MSMDVDPVEILVGTPRTPVRARSGTVVHRPTLMPETTMTGPTTARDRESLLAQLGEVLQKTAVSASFWACVRVSDLEALERLVEQARMAPEICMLLFHNCYAIPRLWMQINLNDKGCTSTTSSTSSNHSSSHKGVPRSMSEKGKTSKRDNGTCVITSIPPIEICHIYPRSLLSENRTGKLRYAVPPFWSLLRMFFNEEQIDLWHREIFRDPDNSDRGVETCENLICLTPQLHRYWGMGKCAFRPLLESFDRTELELEFHWLPKHSHGPLDIVPLDQQQLSTEGLKDSGGSILTTSDFSPLCSGQKFTLRTEDPVGLPLPSFALLQMQWKLNQIVSLSAAAEDTEWEDEPDDGDVSPVPAFNPSHIENWTQQWSDDDDDVTEYSENTHTTASTLPTPEKAQTAAAQTAPVESIHVIDQQ